MPSALITPLYPLVNDPRVIHRIVKPGSYGEGEIETVLFRENGSQRVVIRDRDVVHSMMEIQDDSESLDDKNRMCWATFEEMQDSVLCVLASPTQLRIWDSSSFLGGGEGISLHLPCEATSIFSVEMGILVQRRLVADDQGDHEDDDVRFLSKGTPSPPMASLFSCRHPLKTILPVSNSSIREQLVFVGTTNGVSIAVSFHAELGRHAVWVLDEAPTIRPPEPSSQEWDINPGTKFVVEESFLREDASFCDGLTGGVVSREEALAHALGVGTWQTGGALPSTPAILNCAAAAAPLYPDLSMTLVYEALSSSSCTSKDVFLADTYLCVHVGSELHISRVCNRQILPTATIPCFWAIPIQCAPSAESPVPSGILVMNEGMQLFRGGRLVAECSNPTFRALHDSVGNRFTLELFDGTRLRAELRMSLTPLPERVLTALQAVVGEELALRIRLDCVRLQSDLVDLTIDDPGWVALSCIVKQLLGAHPGEIFENEESSWSMLLGSAYHSNNEEVFPFFECEPIVQNGWGTHCVQASSITSAAYSSDFPDRLSSRMQVFDAVHLLFEDFKLSMLTKPWCRPVGRLLRHCTTELMRDFSDHYDEDVGQQFEPLQAVQEVARTTAFARPPCIMTWISLCMSGRSDECSWFKSSAVASLCPRLDLVQRVFSILASNFGVSGTLDVRLDEAAVQAMLGAGVDDPRILQDDFPFGISLPLLEVLARCRCHPLIDRFSGFSQQAWKFIGREDMIVPNQGVNRIDHQAVKTVETSENDSDGLVDIEASHALRFPTDNRLKEVARLLRSSRPIFLKVPRAIELSDHDYERCKQERLLILCRRVLALPIGRGMFTLGTLKPISVEQLPIPELCLSGRVPPSNNSLTLDLSNSPADTTVWPNFHNGVAAGLRLPNFAEGAPSKITRSWIIYNKATHTCSETSEPGSHLAHAHGGFLMALGLRGHLSALSMTDVYEYLTQGSVTTSVGVLLGMAANKRGTCDPAVSKMLCLHIPSLLPLSFSSIDVSAPAHAAAVTGIGLLYQGSSHRLMTEFLLNEMGRRPIHDSSTIDREAYALSCGMALGMITLANGGSGGNAGLADLEIEQRLYRYVAGGLDDRATRRRQDIADRRVNAAGGIGGDGERCARVHEGDTINNDVTAPGALLALGLMYMKSGNKVIAAGIAIPDTHFLLEYSRPDTLLLRVLARSLILWDEVQPTSTWIQMQVPSVVLSAYLKMQDTAKKNSDHAQGIMNNDMEEGCCRTHENAKSLRQPIQTHAQLQYVKDESEAVGTDQYFDGDYDVDRQTVRQMHAYIVAGSCFSLGLRFAGTADAQAARAITKVLLDMKSFRDSAEPVPVALRPDQPIVGMCLNLCAVSLALVMAGTGDLDTLRLFKTIGWRADEDIRHGTHMALSAAVGLLFLGGGMCTVGRSPEDVAALVAAFFPRFPMDPTDNKYHLQAMRHLYVLAVKERHVEAYDVDSEECVSALVEARFNDNRLQPVQLTTPNLLPNTGSEVSRLVVQSGLYFPRNLCVSGAAAGGVFVYVKKRPQESEKQASDRSLRNFACGRNEERIDHLLLELRGQHREGEFDCGCRECWRAFCCDDVFGCTSKSLPISSLPVLGILGSINSGRTAYLTSDVAILQCYYERSGWKASINHLLDPCTVALILEKVRKTLGSFGSRRSDVKDTSTDVMSRTRSQAG